MLCAGLVGRDVWCPERCVGPACGVSNQRPCSVRVLWAESCGVLRGVCVLRVVSLTSDHALCRSCRQRRVVS